VSECAVYVINMRVGICLNGLYKL